MKYYKEISGGIKKWDGSFFSLSSCKASAPLAKMKVSADELQIDVFFSETIKLCPDQVLGFSEVESIFVRGIVVWHNVRDYPTLLIFTGDPDAINQAIQEGGFICCGIGTIDYSPLTEYINGSKLILFVMALFVFLAWFLINFFR